jgi:hypothetical protein
VGVESNAAEVLASAFVCVHFPYVCYKMLNSCMLCVFRVYVQVTEIDSVRLLVPIYFCCKIQESQDKKTISR